MLLLYKLLLQSTSTFGIIIEADFLKEITIPSLPEYTLFKHKINIYDEEQKN